MIALKDTFETDFELIHADPDEMGDRMTFEIIEKGKPKVFNTRCVWDNYMLKKGVVVAQQGIYLGSVLWFIARKWFEVEPKGEEVIYRILDRPNGKKVKEGWRILDVSDCESVYEIHLDKVAG
jgi:hypothetical protein